MSNNNLARGIFFTLLSFLALQVYLTASLMKEGFLVILFITVCLALGGYIDYFGSQKKVIKKELKQR